MHQYTEAEDVVRGLCRRSRALLGAHGNFGAAAGDLVAARRRRHAEVDEIRQPAAVEQYVRGLDVAVDDAFRVRVPQCIRNHGDRPHGCGRIPACNNTDVGLAQVLQAEIGAVRVVVILEYANDVRMHQAAADAPLPIQEVPLSRVFRGIANQELERDAAAGLPVCNEPDLGGGPGAETAHERVPALKAQTFFETPHRRVCGSAGRLL